ncbi:M57 family metalloprotease [Nitrosomonas sp.]|uniref:M57 family metalloprotease n=1 Tax=Nitrosomonas sp. TaxID=42353 RepID=UPI0025EC240D|nr:M57 family metalloprotease [Nitrosomonas sp.]MBY0483934.1 M10 family metallopeptidase C-terminal domain-containing protein [Nitrosomonas sp.]
MPSITNDYRIDAVLAGSDIRWDATESAKPVVLTYSFMSALPIYADPVQDGNQFSVMTNEQKVAVREILTTLSSQFNISFAEINDSAASYGQLRFGNNAQTTTVGYAYYPDKSVGDNAGDLYINNSPQASQTTHVAHGTNAYSTLIHEIGHTLGLKHPGNYNAAISGGDTNEGPYLTDVEDSELYSIMSYTPQNQGLERINLAPYDYAALSYLYNAKLLNTGDNSYALTEESGQIVQTIYDDGGNDTLDASRINTPVILNLNVAAPGKLSSVGLTPDGQAAENNLSLGLNTLIEHAIGGTGNDKLIGNSSSNTLIGNNGDDTLVGQLGTDTMTGGEGSDIFGISNVGNYFFQDFIPGVDKIGFDNQLGIQNFTQLLPYITGINTQGEDVVVHFVGDVAGITFVGILQQSTALSVADVIFQAL